MKLSDNVFPRSENGRKRQKNSERLGTKGNYLVKGKEEERFITVNTDTPNKNSEQ